MLSDVILSLLVPCLFVGFSVGQLQQQQQCANTRKTHLTLSRVQEPARILHSQFPIVSADQCYDMCCQFQSGDESHCNAAVFTPITTNTGDYKSGNCMLLDCRPTFGNCLWTWSPLADSSVARVVRIEKTSGIQQQTPVRLTEPSNDLITDNTTRVDELFASSSLASSLPSVTFTLATPTTGTTAVPPSDNDDDWNDFDDYEYDSKTSAKVDQQQQQQYISTVAVSKPDDEVVWNLEIGNVDDTDGNQEIVTLPSSPLSAVSTTSSQFVVDALNVKIDHYNGYNNIASVSDDVVDDRRLSSSTKSMSTTSLDRDSDEDGADDWTFESSESRSKSHRKAKTGSDFRDEYNSYYIGAGSPNDDINSIKMTALLLPSAYDSDHQGLQVSAALVATVTLVTIICLLLIAVGCRKVCSSGPRYIALRDDTGSTRGDVPTNYLVAQPSSNQYRASLLAK